MATSLTNTIPIYQTDSEEEEVPTAVQVQRKSTKQTALRRINSTN
jgi:hypothetical protein